MIMDDIPGRHEFFLREMSGFGGERRWAEVLGGVKEGKNGSQDIIYEEKLESSTYSSLYVQGP